MLPARPFIFKKPIAFLFRSAGRRDLSARLGWMGGALVVGLCLSHPDGLLATPPTEPGGAANAIPAGDWRTLADFSEPTSLALNFVELGARQFASTSGSGLEWQPTATNIYSLVYAPGGRPAVVADRTLSVDFLLPTDGSSLGLHLHAADEESLSHLVLVSRSTSDRGLIRVYRTAVWPSLTIAANDQLPSSQTRLTRFTPDAWHRLTVGSKSDEATGRSVLSIRLTSADQVVGSMEISDLSPQSLPAAGIVALRLFAPAGGRIQVRTLLGQPQP